jgi:hypothetical protein
MKNYNQRNQAVLIRDMIDMYHEYSADVAVVEYLSNFAFNMARIAEENKIDDKNLDWDLLFSFLDQKYHQLNTGSDIIASDESKIDNLYKVSNHIINSNETEA